MLYGWIYEISKNLAVPKKIRTGPLGFQSNGFLPKSLKNQNFKNLKKKLRTADKHLLIAHQVTRRECIKSAPYLRLKKRRFEICVGRFHEKTPVFGPPPPPYKNAK